MHMKDLNIYFCGSIKGGRQYAARYREIIGMLKKHGKVLSEHVGDPGEQSPADAGRPDNFIHDRDMDWIRRSDLLVAEVTIPSLGVGYEIGRAIELGKPVLCLFDASSGRVLSSMIAGSKEVRVREYRQTGTIESILDQFIAEHAPGQAQGSS